MAKRTNQSLKAKGGAVTLRKRKPPLTNEAGQVIIQDAPPQEELAEIILPESILRLDDLVATAQSWKNLVAAKKEAMDAAREAALAATRDYQKVDREYRMALYAVDDQVSVCRREGVDQKLIDAHSRVHKE